MRVPRIVSYMGSCFFNGGVATSAGAFSNGGTTFLKNHAPGLHLAFNWSNGLANPGRVREKVAKLRAANTDNRPAVVLYPHNTLSLHYSIIQSWKAEKSDYGLFITPENHTTISVNMGDTFSGEVGVWSIY